MKLAAAVALFAGAVLSMLLQRMQRDASGRYDTTYFLWGGRAACFRLVLLAIAMLGGWDVRMHNVLGQVHFLAATASVYPLVLFSYSFPFNRRAPIALHLGTLVPLLLFNALPFCRDNSLAIRLIPTLGFLPVVLIALYFQSKNAHAVAREAGSRAAAPIRIVQASIAGPWVLAVVMMTVATQVAHGPPPQSVIVAQALLGTIAVIVGIAGAILRYHLFDIRLVAYELVLTVGASASFTAYVVYGAAPLFTVVQRLAGTPLAAAAVTVAPMLTMKAAWRLIHARMYSVACQMARRGPPVGVVERVLADTGRMIDPTEVLNSVSYALERVTRGTARFLRHGTLPAGDFPEAPAALAKVASCDCRAFLARPQVGELAPHFSEAFESLSADLLIPVRRGATLYGFFAVRCDEVSRDTAQVCATLADHVAIKLENFVLYTEASARSRELDETRLFLENLVESLPVGVAVLDRENRVKAWNPALAASSGVTPECAMGKHYFRDLFPGLLSAGAQSIVDSLRKDPWKIVHRAGMAGHIAGGPEHVDLTVAAFRSRTGLPDGVVVITQDATERVLLGRELEESRRLASLGAFAAAIAHDIRTPLTSIQMNVQILRSRGVLSEGDNEYLDIASEEIERLNRSVGEILDYAKPLALSVEATDVDDLLDDVVRTVQPVFGERRVALVRGPRRPELRVGVDARRMRTALVNLLDNAADASPSGTCVELSAALGDDGRVCIRVEDHGRGIDEANLEKVFEPFFTTRPDGTGLGLAIARKVVRAHGGELDVRSTVGEGTTFTIALAAGSRGSLEPSVAVSSARRFASSASS